MKEIPRRNFLRTGALGFAAFTIVPRRVLGGPAFIPPSDRITLGFIGTGKQARGSLLPSFADKARIVAVCDVDSQKMEKFRNVTQSLYEKQGLPANGIKQYDDFRELLNDKGIDGVVIATPDHWHAVNVIEAAKAGKDIYCEKPFSHSIRQGRLMIDAIKKFGRVCQVGSMQRSMHNFWHACQLVRNGFLGEIQLIKVNIRGPYFLFPQSCNLPSQMTPESLNWDMWIGPARYRDYHGDLAPTLENDFWAKWRMYRDYGTGTVGDWGAHMFDIIQWALGKDDSGPMVMAPSGSNFEHMTYIYDNGIRVLLEDFNGGRGVRFIGSKGTLTITRELYETTPAELASYEFKEKEITLYRSTDHYQNWLDCIKSREEPVAPPEIGHRTATVGHMGIIANRLQRSLRWDPAKEEFVCDDEANQLAVDNLRKPWTLDF